MNSILSPPSGLDEAKAVATRIDQFFDERVEMAAVHGGQYRSLWQAARKASEGGKKLRPALVVSTYQEFGGNDIGDAVHVATAFELLHTAFLLHDDVIDRDTVRRGRLNLVGAFAEDAAERGATENDAMLWGQASAILAGDLLIYSAQSIVARLMIAENQRTALLDLFDRCVFVTAAGELADVAFATHVENPELSDVFAMSEHKTASYSFAGPLQAGATLAGAREDELHTLGEFGRMVGTAFQLRDDVLGVFGTELVTGKSVISDLRAGKITPLIAYAHSSRYGDELKHILARPEISDADGEVMRGLLEQCGARNFVEGMIGDYAHRAMDLIESSSLPDGLRSRLLDVAQHATVRLR